MADSRIVCFGALNVDLIFRVAERLIFSLGYQLGYEYLGRGDQLDKLLSVLNSQCKLSFKSGGGSAANTAVALQRLGVPTGFVGKVGADQNGKFLLSQLEDVDNRAILRGGESGIAISLITEESKDRSLIIFPNANDTLTFEEIDISYVRSIEFLHLTSFFGNLPFEAQKNLVTRLPPQVSLSFDPGMPYVSRGLEAIRPLVSKTYILFLEKKEVEILTKKVWYQGSEELLGMGPKIVVCKMGSEGSHVFTHGDSLYVPAIKVEVVDTTGAGDVYVAGFLAYLIQGKSFRECAEFATQIAGMSVTGLGRTKYPSPTSCSSSGRV